MESSRHSTAALPDAPMGPDYARFLDCVHCGLCTAACPTYLETGDENNSPRGRIHLMRAVEENRIQLDAEVSSHLDLCLDCRACETACPSGVQYGRLIEPFRASKGHQQSWLSTAILGHLFPYRSRLRVALGFARVLQASGCDAAIKKLGLLKLAPPLLQRMHRLLPDVSRANSRRPKPPLPQVPATETVGLLLGCVADGMFRPLHEATTRVLTAAGCTVVAPSEQGCCGAISYHGPAPKSAIGFIKRNLAAFDVDSLDAIIVNVAGCGAMLKELGSIVREVEPGNTSLHRQCDKFAAKVQDVNEFLAPRLDRLPINASVNEVVVYHAACHLHHAQRVKEAPLQLLESIPGLEVRMPDELEICCGAAGSYNLTQPEMAQRLGRRKVERLLSANGGVAPDAIAAANVGCALHLAAEFRDQGHNVPVTHPVEFLDRALG